MEYDFRSAKPHELEEIFSLYEKRIQWMDQTGIRQWNTTDYLNVYPISYYAEHQRLGQLYVLCRDSRIIGAVVLLKKDARWQGEETPASYYVHNLVTALSAKGAGRIILSELEKIGIRSAMERMRLDCAVDNAFLNEYYSSLGYQMVGTCVDGAYVGNRREKILCRSFPDPGKKNAAEQCT